MAKRALCVGINLYPTLQNKDLKGCVNDANAWAALLNEHFDFASTDITMLIDGEATKAKMLASIDHLLAGAQAGDVLVFTNSSHGALIPDTSGDEPRFDQTICPCDAGRETLVIDDELRVRFANLPEGVNLTVISDSCHSGTVTRLAPFEDIRIREVYAEDFGIPRLNEKKTEIAQRTRALEAVPESEMKEVLLSGCSDSQSSFDALIGDTYHGAMTYYALEAIRTANYRITYNQLIEATRQGVAVNFSQQTPQLEGSDLNKGRQVFS